MNASYSASLKNCHTINQVNRLHITLDNTMTPVELYKLYGNIKQPSPLIRLKALLTKDPSIKLQRAGINALKKSVYLVEKSGKSTPELFDRDDIDDNIKMYSSEALPSDEKTLIIAFGGGQNRLMMPIPCFLQHLSADKFDLLLLTDPNRQGFTRGIPGVANNIDSLIKKIDELIDRDCYKSVISFGTSAGGLPAILTTLQLRLDKGISIGGSGPMCPRWKAVDPFSPDKELLVLHNGTPNLLYIHGAGDKLITSNILELEEIIPIKTLSVDGKDGTEVGHNPLLPLLSQSKLSNFLSVVLDPTIVGYDHELTDDKHSKLWV